MARAIRTTRRGYTAELAIRTMQDARHAPGAYRFAKQNGFSIMVVLDWTSSAGDWSFLVSQNGKEWQILSQTNNWPRSGFTYNIGTEIYEGTFDEVVQQIAAQFGDLGDIVDIEEPRLWSAIAIVASEAPSGAARAYAENARQAAADGGPEGLRVQLLYVLASLSGWNTPRARQVKEILSEYARPRKAPLGDLPSWMFRKLSPKEEAAFRKWARDNYVPGSPIDPAWHPVVRAECEVMNKEALFKHMIGRRGN